MVLIRQYRRMSGAMVMRSAAIPKAVTAKIARFMRIYPRLALHGPAYLRRAPIENRPMRGTMRVERGTMLNEVGGRDGLKQLRDLSG
jgi:hypothetical protein